MNDSPMSIEKITDSKEPIFSTEKADTRSKPREVTDQVVPVEHPLVTAAAALAEGGRMMESTRWWLRYHGTHALLGDCPNLGQVLVQRQDAHLGFWDALTVSPMCVACDSEYEIQAVTIIEPVSDDTLDNGQAHLDETTGVWHIAPLDAAGLPVLWV